MSKIAFKVICISRVRLTEAPNVDIPPIVLMAEVYNDNDSDSEDEMDESDSDEDSDDEMDLLVALTIEENKFNNTDIKDSITASIRNGIQCKSDDEQSTEAFLKQRITEGLQDYNKLTNGLLLRTVSRTSMEDDDLMSAIRGVGTEWSGSEWIRIKRVYIGTPFNVYKCYVDLKEFGFIMMTVEAKMFDIGNNGTLTHRLCCDISSRLFQESVHSTWSPYPEDFYNILLAGIDWKISELELPETLRKQLVTTLRWMIWTEILAKPV